MVLSKFCVPLAIFVLIPPIYAQTARPQPGAAAVAGQSPGSRTKDPAGAASNSSSPTDPANAPTGNAQAAPKFRPGGYAIRVVPQNPAPAPASIAPLAPAEAHRQPPLPPYLAYRAFFLNMSALDQFADREERAGRRESALRWRTYDQAALGLNDAEGEILKEMERDCNHAVRESDNKATAAIRNFRAKSGGDVTAPLPDEILQMVGERETIMNSCIERLREALGKSSFQKLDHYVQSAFQPRMISPKPAQRPTSAKDRKENQ